MCEGLLVLLLVLYVVSYKETVPDTDSISRHGLVHAKNVAVFPSMRKFSAGDINSRST